MELNFKGFILSDWQGAHSAAKASAAGLDHEEPGEIFFGDAMKRAVQSGRVPMIELDEHVRRILRSMFACGVIDDPPQKSVVDVVGGFEVSRRIAEHGIVLLRNENSQLPLDASKLHSIAVIGAHADVGMISGGGSAQVDPPGGNAIMPPGKGATKWQDHIWFPTSPLKTIRGKALAAKVQFDPGTDSASAAALAKSADVAIVFAYQWESEGMDLDSLSLPEHQDDLIAAVAAANPHAIVVLETGSSVTMPWASQVSGILEAWYAGSQGAEAPRGLEQGQTESRAESGSGCRDRSAVSVDLQRRAEHVAVSSGRLHIPGRRFLAEPAAKGIRQPEIVIVMTGLGSLVSIVILGWHLSCAGDHR